ncbi:hypothetical protein [Actinoplanes sp. OR16]|uniref:hypothetical protein n=1 Tax=Actinoplanes sp. OR16 TaxID=946334 RepID=UPI00351A54B9
MVIVTGAGPQSNVMMPPAATALTTAAEVQLFAVPVPTVRVGSLVSTALAAAGTEASPSGLPGFGSLRTAVEADADADADGEPEAEGDDEEDGEDEGAVEEPETDDGTGREVTRPSEPPL